MPYVHQRAEGMGTLTCAPCPVQPRLLSLLPASPALQLSVLTESRQAQNLQSCKENRNSALIQTTRCILSRVWSGHVTREIQRDLGGEPAADREGCVCRQHGQPLPGGSQSALKIGPAAPPQAQGERPQPVWPESLDAPGLRPLPHQGGCQVAGICILALARRPASGILLGWTG